MADTCHRTVEVLKETQQTNLSTGRAASPFPTGKGFTKEHHTMSQATKNPAGLLVRVLFENLDPTNRVEVLTQTVKRTIAEHQDETSVELIRWLYEAFNLGQSMSVNAETEKKDVAAGAVTMGKAERRMQFCNLLMAAYPLGSIRRKDRRAYPDPKPDFMGTRKEILRHIADLWEGTPADERSVEHFAFLRNALAAGDDHVPLLEDERSMVLAVVRERLRAPFFTERVLRQWMFHLGAIKKTAEDNDLFMLLAMARIKNGGASEVYRDIAARTEAEMRAEKS